MKLLFNADNGRFWIHADESGCTVPAAYKEMGEELRHIGPSEAEVRINDGAELCRACFTTPPEEKALEGE